MTDAGLEHLTNVEGLQVQGLNLSLTQVTDAGLEHLKGALEVRLLQSLESLVTDTGVEALKRALPGCEIDH